MNTKSTDRHQISALERIRSGLTIGTGSLILALALVLTSGASTPVLAGTAGAFAKALKDKFCTGTSGEQWYGCYAYMHYRVDLVKSRSSAKSTCYSNGCKSKYGSGTSYEKCKTGCDKAYVADIN